MQTGPLGNFTKKFGYNTPNSLQFVPKLCVRRKAIKYLITDKKSYQIKAAMENQLFGYVPGSEDYDCDDLTLMPAVFHEETEQLPTQQSGEIIHDGKNIWMLATCNIETTTMDLPVGDIVDIEVDQYPERWVDDCDENNPHDRIATWRDKQPLTERDSLEQWKKDFAVRGSHISRRLLF